jgi:hypothetical protein
VQNLLSHQFHSIFHGIYLLSHQFHNYHFPWDLSLIPPISYHFPWVFIGFSEIPWVFHRCSRTGSHMASNWPQRCQADNPGEFLLAGKMMYHQMIFIGVYSDSGT